VPVVQRVVLISLHALLRASFAVYAGRVSCCRLASPARRWS
jgi:hypothetical protein